MLIIIFLLLGGIITGLVIQKRTRLIVLSNRFMEWLLSCLFLSKGITVGLNGSILSNLGNIALIALVIVFGIFIVSMLLDVIILPFIFPVAYNKETLMIRNGIRLVGFFAVGVFLAQSGFFHGTIQDGAIGTYVLLVLILLTGVTIGVDKNSLEVFKNIVFQFIFVSAIMILGNLIGVLFITIFLPGQQLKEVFEVSISKCNYSLWNWYGDELYWDMVGVSMLVVIVIGEVISLFFTQGKVVCPAKMPGYLIKGSVIREGKQLIIEQNKPNEWCKKAIYIGLVFVLFLPFLSNMILKIL